jgi:putative spermidine/putrescine transport system permease protein
MNVRRPIRLMALAAPGAVFLLFFFGLPLAVVLRESLTGGGVHFIAVFLDPVFLKGLRGTLILGTLAPGVSLLVGFAVAWHLSGLTERRRTGLIFWISLPLTFSGLIIAYGFILSFGRAGFVTLLLARIGFDPAVVGGLIYSPAGLGFAYCYYLIPRVVLMLLPVLVNFDRSQLIAAESLGAARIRAIVDILIPQVLPAAISAYALVAAVAIGAYGTALALVGTQVNILPLELYSRISGTGSDFPGAAAMSVILLALCCLVLGGGEWLAAWRSSEGR